MVMGDSMFAGVYYIFIDDYQMGMRRIARNRSRFSSIVLGFKEKASVQRY